MKTNYQITNTKNFQLTNIFGRIDLKTSINILAGTIKLLKSRHQNKILVDARGTKTILNLPDTCEFLDQLAMYRELHNDRIAILFENRLKNDTAKFFEVAAEGRGFQIKLFYDDFEAAVKWLMQNEANSEYIHFLKN